MKYLLDTHVFLWLIGSSDRLPTTYRSVIQDESSELYLSLASIWEATIKQKIGKLPLPADAASYLIDLRDRHGVNALDIDDGTIRIFQSLEEHHKDPFDHLILSHALQHNLTVISVDGQFEKYPVTLLKSTTPATKR